MYGANFELDSKTGGREEREFLDMITKNGGKGSGERKEKF